MPPVSQLVYKILATLREAAEKAKRNSHPVLRQTNIFSFYVTASPLSTQSQLRCPPVEAVIPNIWSEVKEFVVQPCFA